MTGVHPKQSSPASRRRAGRGKPRKIDLGLGLSHGRRTLTMAERLAPAVGGQEHGRRHGPDFVIAGMSKCGSSTLAALLSAHPQIDFCAGKESNFFLWDIAQGWGWYESLFAHERSAEHLRGDGSIFYSASQWEGVASTWMHRCVPDAKIIWIARDPIKRLESSFREAHHSGHFFNYNAPYAIGDMVRFLPSVIDDTLYWQRVEHYLAKFPRENMHLMLLEDLARDPVGELRRVWRFLGCGDDLAIEGAEEQKFNAGETKLYDSRVMRALRTSRLTGPMVRRIPAPVTDWIGAAVGLRIRFSKPVVWHPDDLRWTQDRLREDARRFLEEAGKSPTSWGWVANHHVDAVPRAA